MDLFPANDVAKPRGKRRLQPPDDPTEEDLGRLPRQWTGSGRYNIVRQIGKGAFATVYRVTSKFDGRPWAAKELDKRKFMKNGVLDQKVENEMKIMQRVKHVSIERQDTTRGAPADGLSTAQHCRIPRALGLGQSTFVHHHGVRSMRRPG